MTDAVPYQIAPGMWRYGERLIRTRDRDGVWTAVVGRVRRNLHNCSQPTDAELPSRFQPYCTLAFDFLSEADAVEGAKDLIDGECQPRLATPRDIDKARRNGRRSK